jgi:hypothetical protein
MRKGRRISGVGVFLLGLALLGAPSMQAQEEEREPVTLSVVVVNPSEEKTQVVPVRIDLPAEVKPMDVLDDGGLQLEFDDERSAYYVYKNDVALAPKETRVFEVRVNDIWFIKPEELNSLRDYTQLLLKRIEGSDYYETAKSLAQSIEQRLTDIQTVQDDPALSRKARIGAYRQHLGQVEGIKEDLARMEKLLTFIGGPPVPEMLEKSPLKSDAPSETTTWILIGLIVIFIGMIGTTFFFTWNRRTQVSDDIAIVRQATYGEGEQKE